MASRNLIVRPTAMSMHRKYLRSEVLWNKSLVITAQSTTGILLYL